MISGTKIAYCPLVIFLPSFSITEPLIVLLPGTKPLFHVSLQLDVVMKKSLGQWYISRILGCNCGQVSLMVKGTSFSIWSFCWMESRCMTGPSAAILDYEATLKVETKHYGPINGRSLTWEASNTPSEETTH